MRPGLVVCEETGLVERHSLNAGDDGDRFHRFRDPARRRACRDRARLQRCRARRGGGDAGGGVEDASSRANRAGDRRRPARVRREPCAGGEGQMAAAFGEACRDRAAPDRPDAIQSVDRPSLAEALAKEIIKQGRSPLLLVEINTGAEAQKAGVLPQDADAFLEKCRAAYGLTISGLMCIPPLDEAPGPHFALTAKIARRNGLKLLSMGMSADFVTAIQLGATHVRVGSAIFGERN